MSTAYLMARQRPYSSALGSAARVLGVLVIIRCGLRHSSGKRKANGSADQSASHIALLLFKPDSNEGPTNMLASRS
jgi:hypothetical protein